MLNAASSAPNSSTYHKVRRTRTVLNIFRFQTIGEKIAFAAPGMDQRPAESLIYLFPEPPHVHVDDIRKRIEVFIPDVLRDLVSAHKLSLSKDKKLEQRILLCGEAYRAACAVYGMACGVESEIGNLKRP